MKNDIQKYVSCMEEIKRRIAVISDFISRKSTTGYIMTDAEFMYLQFRKVFELIALSSLSANMEKYEEISDKFHKEWAAEKIIEHLERINPDFYPIPTKQVVYDNEGKFKKVELIEKGFLTKKEFPEVLDKCRGFLHAVNPYKNKMPADPEVLWNMFEGWGKKIKILLNYHYAQLVDGKEPLWVIMQATTDGKAHVYEFLEKDTNS